jgi:hypothetical protein
MGRRVRQPSPRAPSGRNAQCSEDPPTQRVRERQPASRPQIKQTSHRMLAPRGRAQPREHDERPAPRNRAHIREQHILLRRTEAEIHRCCSTRTREPAGAGSAGFRALARTRSTSVTRPAPADCIGRFEPVSITSLWRSPGQSPTSTVTIGAASDPHGSPFVAQAAHSVTLLLYARMEGDEHVPPLRSTCAVNSAIPPMQVSRPRSAGASYSPPAGFARLWTRTASSASARMPCFSSGPGTRTRRRGPVRRLAFVARDVSWPKSRPPCSSPPAGRV